MKKVFLGGTCNGSSWCDEIITLLRERGIKWFDPVVEIWTESCRAREIKERETCNFVLYTITPKMTGVYSIAEVVDDSNKRPDKTILVLLQNDEGLCFSKEQWKSLNAVSNMVARNGGAVFGNLKSAVAYINNKQMM